MTSRKEISSVHGTSISQPGQEEQWKAPLLQTKSAACGKGFWAALLQWPSIWPEGHTWKLRLTKVESHEMVFDHGILLPAHLTLVKRFWLAIPAKRSPSSFWKLLQALHRWWTIPANITFGLPGPLTGVMEAQHVSPQRPREADKAVSVGTVLGKYKAAPTSCRQHLVPSLACVENPQDCPCLNPSLCAYPGAWKLRIATSENLLLANAIDKTGQGFFCPDSVVAGKCPILSVLTNSLRFFFTPFRKHPQSSALGFRMNCS